MSVCVMTRRPASDAALQGDKGMEENKGWGMGGVMTDMRLHLSEL